MEAKRGNYDHKWMLWWGIVLPCHTELKYLAEQGIKIWDFIWWKWSDVSRVFEGNLVFHTAHLFVDGSLKYEGMKPCVRSARSILEEAVCSDNFGSGNHVIML